jgi:hypothetical protein
MLQYGGDDDLDEDALVRQAFKNMSRRNGDMS